MKCRYISRVFAAILAISMAVSLVACGKKDETTAAELMAMLQGMRSDAHYTARIDLDVSGEQDGQAVELKLGADLESCGGVAHLSNADIMIGSEGMSFALGMDAWMDQAAGAAYINMSMMGMEMGWSKSELSDSDIADATGNMNVVWPASANFVLAEHEKDQDYIVTWEITPDMIRQAMADLGDGNAASDMLGGAGLDDLSDTSVTSCMATAAFDSSTKQPKRVEINLSGEDINTCKLVVTFSVFEGEPVVLSVPQDVIDAANNSDANSNAGFGSGFDDWDASGGNSDWNLGANVVEEEHYSNDGDGYDALIDGMAENLRANMPDGYSVSVLHFSDHTSMVVRYEPDDLNDLGWHGDVEIRNMTDENNYNGAMEYFENDRSFYDSWYEAGAMESGDDFAIYYRDGELNYICIVGAMTIDVSVYSSTLDYDGMMSGLTDLLLTAGLS